MKREPTSPTRRKADPQAAVRVGAFERALDGFKAEIDGEMATKTALLLEEYHRRKVAPLEQRVAALERTWYRRLRGHLLAAWRRITAPPPRAEGPPAAMEPPK